LHAFDYDYDYEHEHEYEHEHDAWDHFVLKLGRLRIIIDTYLVNCGKARSEE